MNVRIIVGEKREDAAELEEVVSTDLGEHALLDRLNVVGSDFFEVGVPGVREPAQPATTVVLPALSGRGAP